MPEAEVPLADAVATYLFNSQLLARADGRYTLVAPAEAQEHPRTRALLDRLVTPAGPIDEVDRVRPAPEHAQRRRPGLPAAAGAR